MKKPVSLTCSNLPCLLKAENISTELRITDDREIINIIILGRITKNYNS